MSLTDIGGYRLSPQQTRLWKSLRDGDPLCVQCAILLEGRVSVGKIREALNRVIERHEILRTTFHKLDGLDYPTQVIRDFLGPSWSEVSLTDCGPIDRGGRIKETFEKEKRQPYDFRNGPVVNACFLTFSDAEHVLILRIAGLCADGRTLKNIVEDLSLAYGDGFGKEGYRDTVTQYVDFAEWQNELHSHFADSGDAQQELELWNSELFASIYTLAFPLEKRFPSHGNYGSEVIQRPLDGDSLARIEEAALVSGTSLSVFLLACWKTLIHRYALEENVVVANTVDGRNYERFHRACGSLSKWVPVHCEFDSSLTFTEILLRVKESVETAYELQEYFAWEDSIGAKDNLYNETIQLPIGYEFLDYSFEHLSCGLKFSIIDQYSSTERYRIKCQLNRFADALVLNLRYDPNLYDRDYVAQIAKHLTVLAENAAKTPSEPIGKLEMLDGSDHHQILVSFNDTRTEYPSGQSFHRLFEQQVDRTPQRPAIAFGGTKLSYLELNARANQLAHFVVRKGCLPGTRIGLFLERSIEIVVGLLGVAKAGGVYIPMDPGDPKERLEKQIDASSMRMLISQRKTIDRSPAFNGEVVSLDPGETALEKESVENLEVRVSPQDLIYVIFTSGSTGIPKGVAIQHQNIVNYAHFISEKLHLRDTESEEGLHFANVSTISADLGNTCIFPSLMSGGCLHIIPYDIATHGVRFGRYIHEEQIDVLKIVPSHFGALLESCNGWNVFPKKYLVLGGESFSLDLLEKIAAASPSCKVVNHYGPTETTVGSLTFDVPKSRRCDGVSANVPIGRPIANTDVYVLDPERKPVAIGVPGELYIGGAGVAKGYLDAPRESSERFLSLPFTANGLERVYKTGDVVRWLPNGNVEFIGRIDDQIKVRGYRVEPGEIESVLKRHPAVKECVVLARENGSGERRLVAYLVPRDRVVRIDDTRTREMPTGIVIADRNKHETDFFYQQIFVERNNHQCGVVLNGGSLVFDVGANIGLFSLFVHRECKEARVYAFEPIPELFDLLKINAGMHGLNGKLYQCGLSDKDREATFTYYPNSSCQSGYYADASEDRKVVKSVIESQIAGKEAVSGSLSGEVEELLDERMRSEPVICRLRRISDVIREDNIERIDLLKIDVERSELDVLGGIDDDHWDTIKQIVIEAHDLEDQLDRIRELLRTRGYDVQMDQGSFLEETGIYNIYAIRRNDRDTAETRQRDRRCAFTAESEIEPILSINHLRSYIREELPEYMLPAAFVVMDALPLTKNGKIDREALPAEEQSGNGTETLTQAPRSPTEETLVGIWSEVLGRDRLGVHDNFFNVGGHSLLAIRIVSRIRDAFDIELPLSGVFSAPTVAGLAASIEKLLKGTSD